MKKTITALLFLTGTLAAQTITATFEGFTLQPASFYKDTTDKPFVTDAAIFTYDWTGGLYPFWSGGFSYTNRYDSATAGFTNLYGVKPYTGYNASATYVVGQDGGIIRMRYPQTVAEGFYFTNTTYAYKSMKNGDMFARKFGDTTGTGSGTTIPQGAYPDYFKMVVRGYLNGALKNDSVEIYLADYRFSNSAQDYIVKDWQFANTSALGVVDSIRFTMRSSDNSVWGMNTPGFFGLDNFVTSNALMAGISRTSTNDLKVFPQPCSDFLVVQSAGEFTFELISVSGAVILQGEGRDRQQLDLGPVEAGIYLLKISSENAGTTTRIIKQ